MAYRITDDSVQFDQATTYAGSDAGSVADGASGVAVAHYGSGVVQKTVFTFTDHAIALAMADSGTDLLPAYGGSKLFDMPAGAIMILGAVSDIDLTKSSAGVTDTWDGDFGVGTATVASDATLSGTEQNIIPSTATPQAVAGATTANGQSTATENAVIDGTTTALDIYLNFLVDAADHTVETTACNLVVNGTLTLHWINLGDY
jgi:hypothetical protein